MQQRRKQAARWFLARVFFLLALMSGVAYAAWVAPWAKSARAVRIETKAQTEAQNEAVK